MVFMWSRNVVVEGQVVGISHPAEAVCVFNMAPREMFRSPASDGLTDISRAADDDSEDNDDDDGVTVVETIHEIVIFPRLPLGTFGDQRHYLKHGDVGGSVTVNSHSFQGHGWV